MRCVIVAALLLLSAPYASAQRADGGAAIAGTAYDSLRAEPIRGGLVSIVGSVRTTTTDDSGRFRLDGVPAGEHTIALQHDGLDSIGVYGLTSRVSVRDAEVEVQLTVPSFATLWRRVCGGEHVPADTGFVYGAVRSILTNEPVAGATVALSWLDLHIAGKSDVIQQRRHGRVITDSTGGYAICGVPRGTGAVILAASDSARSGMINLPPADLPIVRRDLFLSPSAGDEPRAHGTVAGRITTADGMALGGARVLVDGTLEAIADASGAYVARNVPAGTRQIEIKSIAMMPVTIILDIAPGRTTTFDTRLRKVTTLDVVRVTASARTLKIVSDFENRRRRGLAQVRDSTYIERFPGVLGALQGSGLARLDYRGGRPVSIQVPHPRGECEPLVLLDGFRSTAEVLTLVRGSDVAAIEVFRLGMTTPVEYQRNIHDADCGLILIWSKRAFGARW